MRPLRLVLAAVLLPPLFIGACAGFLGRPDPHCFRVEVRLRDHSTTVYRICGESEGLCRLAQVRAVAADKMVNAKAVSECRHDR